MSLLSPIQQTSHGINAWLKGFHWLRRNPRYLTLLFVPVLLGFIFMAVSLGVFFSYDDLLIDKVLFAKPESWWGVSLYYITLAFTWLGGLILCIIAGILFSSVIASPVQEIVSMRVEQQFTGSKAEEISLMKSLLLIGEELKKVIFILSASVIVLIIPGLNLLTIPITALFLGWDAYDYPLARRGFSFKQRMEFVRGDIWAVLGLGLWLVIPFVQILLLPLAVPGGTLLAMEALHKKGLVKRSDTHSVFS